MKHSKIHIDFDSGLAHLASSLMVPSVILFGPTPLKFFGYEQNVNLQEGECRDCWYSTHNWGAKCPRGFDVPLCMERISPARVLLEAEKIISNMTSYGLNIINILILNVMGHSWEDLVENSDVGTADPSELPKTLLIFEKPVFSKIIEKYGPSHNFDFICSDQKKLFQLSQREKDYFGNLHSTGVSLRWNSSFSLSVTSLTYQTVILLFVLGETQTSTLKIEEALRVLAPGGRLIIYSAIKKKGNECQDMSVLEILMTLKGYFFQVVILYQSPCWKN